MERFMAVVKIKEGVEQKDLATILPEERLKFGALIANKTVDPFYTIEGLKIFWNIINANNLEEAEGFMFNLPLYKAGLIDIEIYKLLEKTPF